MSLKLGDIVTFEGNNWVVIEIWTPSDRISENKIMVNYLDLQSVGRDFDSEYYYSKTHEPNVRKVGSSVNDLEERYFEYISGRNVFG